jgi:DNA-binding MarR family transcriptional regulator
MPGQPSLTQMVGRAESAFGALLAQVLTPLGATFHQWVCLSLLASSSGALATDSLTERVSSALKVDRALVLTVLESLTADGFLHGDHGAGEIVLTPRGRERFDELRRAIEAATASMYEGLSDNEIATTRRVLELLIARANLRIGERHT